LTLAREFKMLARIVKKKTMLDGRYFEGRLRVSGGGGCVECGDGNEKVSKRKFHILGEIGGGF
jgi:hypothetical protein